MAPSPWSTPIATVPANPEPVEPRCRCSTRARARRSARSFARRGRRHARHAGRGAGRRPTDARRCARPCPAVAAPAGARLPDERARQLPALPARRRLVSPMATPPVVRGGPVADAGDPASRSSSCRLAFVRSSASGWRAAGSALERASPCRPRAVGDRGRGRRPTRPSDRSRRVGRGSPVRRSRRRRAAAPTPHPSTERDPDADPERTPSPGPTAKPKPTPKPPSARAALLKRARTSRLLDYTIRSGDNLFSIANYFGVPLRHGSGAQPWTRTEGLRAGSS